VKGDREAKPIRQEIIDAAAKAVPKAPSGVKGEGAIAFGGGAVLTAQSRKLLEESDPEQLVKLG
jgi:15-cis-phytoene desaturase